MREAVTRFLNIASLPQRNHYVSLGIVQAISKNPRARPITESVLDNNLALG